MHPDAGMDDLKDLNEWAKVYSVFVYLADVERDMAALDVRPGTHTHFHFLIPEEASMLGSVPTVRMTVPSGESEENVFILLKSCAYACTHHVLTIC